MSGHSKWHNIKRKKELTDAKKSKEFSKISRLLMVAARQGGGDVNANANLRLIVQKAKEVNMPKENVDKAIKKGTGELGGVSFEEVIYEGYGPLGGGVIVKCLTDNKNRTVSEMRNIFTRAGGNLGTSGSTSYIFTGENKSPTFYVSIDTESDAEKIAEFIDTLEAHDDVQEVLHNYEGL